MNDDSRAREFEQLQNFQNNLSWMPFISFFLYNITLNYLLFLFRKLILFFVAYLIIFE